MRRTGVPPRSCVDNLRSRRYPEETVLTSSLGPFGLPFRAVVVTVAAVLFTATGLRAENGVNPQAGSSPEAGATLEDRTELVREPSIWQVLSAQYEVPTTPPQNPFISGLRDVPAELTLRDAVLTAVQSNPAVIAESLTPLAQETGILEAQAQFDPIFGAQAGFDRRTSPAANLLQAGLEDQQPIIQENNGDWNFSLGKQFRSGATLSLDFTNRRQNTNSPFLILAPQYLPQTIASISQPLLRGFGLYFTSLRIRVAETATDASIENYRAAVANFIRSVVTNYWAVVGLEERLEVLRGSLELAEKTVRENRTRVDVGVLPPVAVLESQAEAARRKEEVIVATNDLSQARLQLRQQVYLQSDNPFLPRAVNPIDRPAAEPIQITVEDALRIAMEKRPEIHAAKLTYRGSELNKAFAENQTLPQLDFVGSLGVNGLAGREVPSPNPVAPPFQGGYGDALNTMVDGRFYSYSAGVRIEIPIGNAGARSRATRARVEEQQSFTRYRQTVSDVSLEVGRAVSDVRSDLERIETTRVAQELSEQNLRNQTKRYEVGMVTTTDLLQFQNDLAAAKVAHIQAMIEYNISRAELDRSQGTLLSRFNVTIEPRGETETPWWATF